MPEQIKVLFSILFISTFIYSQDVAPTVANPIADITTNEDTSNITIDLTSVFTDNDNDDLAITKTIQSNSNSSLVSASISGNTLTLDYESNQNGSATITVRGTSNGLTVDDSFTVTVTAVNDEPSFTKGLDITVNEDSGTSTTANWATSISAGPSNESSQSLTFNVSNDNTSLFSNAPSVNSSGTLTFISATDANGSATVTVSVSDNGGTSNGGDNISPNQTFTITVIAVNDEPSFTKGLDITVNEDSGASTTTNWATSISAGPSNESSQSLTFNVSNDNTSLFSNAPFISSAGTLTFTPASNENGSTTVTVSLSDDGGTSNGGDNISPETTFTITVNSVNDGPTASAGSDIYNIIESSVSTMNITITDVSSSDIDDTPSNSHTYSWEKIFEYTANNDNTSITSNEKTPTFALQVGHYQFELTVIDTTTNDVVNPTDITTVLDTVDIYIGQPGIDVNINTVFVKSDDIAYLDITYFENEYASATRSLDQIVISRPSSQSNKFDFVRNQDISAITLEIISGDSSSTSDISIASISESSVIINVNVSHISNNFRAKLKNVSISPVAVTSDFNLAIKNSHYSPEFNSTGMIRIGDPNMSTSSDQVLIISDPKVQLLDITIYEDATVAAINKIDNIVIQIPSAFENNVKWIQVPTASSNSVKIGTISIDSSDSTKLLIDVTANFSAGESLILTGGYVKVGASEYGANKMIAYINGMNIDPDIENNNSIIVTQPQLSFASSKQFVVNDTAVSFPRITLTESSLGASIYTSNPEDSILLRFDDPCITWEPSSIAEYSGYSNTAPGINLSNNNRVAAIKINGPFSLSESLHIDGLKVNICSDRVISSKLEFSIRSDPRFYLKSSSVSGNCVVGKPSINATSNEFVNIHSQSEVIENLIIKEDANVPIINTSRKIIVWAPDPLIWDNNISLLTLRGQGMSKVNPEATYSSDNKQLQIGITSSFSGFDSLVISGMRVKKDGNYSGDFASSTHFKMSLPESSDSFYPVHLDNSRSDLSISYSSAHLEFESSQGANRIVFIKGGENSEIINVTIFGGSLSNSINSNTDIKLMLPTSLNLAWVENQSAQIDPGTPVHIINKVASINSLAILPNTNNKVLNLNVLEAFSIKDSIKINNLSVENNTKVNDMSKIDYLSLLQGDYVSNNYVNNQADSLIVAAPQMMIAKDITVITGALENINIPPITIIDDTLEQVLNIGNNNFYYLSLEGISNYEWDSGLTCSNMLCTLSDNKTIKFLIQSSGTLTISNLKLKNVTFDNTDDAYRLVLKDNNTKMIAKSINTIKTGMPEIDLITGEIWVDLDSIKPISTLKIKESINHISADSVKLYFDKSYLKWDQQSSVQSTINYGFPSEGELYINQYENGSNSALDLSAFNFLMTSDVFKDITQADTVMNLNCVLMDEYNQFTITHPIILNFDPLISDVIPLGGATWDSLTLSVIINENFLEDEGTDLSSIRPTLLLLDGEGDTSNYDIDVSFTQTAAQGDFPEGVYTAEFYFPESLIDIVTAKQENNDVDLLLSFSRSNSSKDNWKLTPISLGWSEDITNIYLDQSLRYLNPDSNDIVFTLPEPISTTCEIRINNLVSDSTYELGTMAINENSTITIEGTQIQNALGRDADGIYDIILQDKSSGSFSFPFIKRIIIDTSPPQFISINPTTDVFDSGWNENSVHSITDQDKVILTFKDYPIMTTVDSIFIYNSGIVSATAPGGYLFNDSIDIQISFELTDSNGNDTSYTFLNTDENGLLDFYKESIIKLSDHQLEGKNSIIINYVLSDHAGNEQNYTIKYVLYNASDIQGLVDNIFNFPNPFSSVDEGTRIRYSLTQEGNQGKYVVFNAKGELVYHYSLSSSELQQGTHTIYWDGHYLNNNYLLATGVYFGFLDIDDKIAKHKIAIIN